MSKPFVLITCPKCNHELLELRDNMIYSRQNSDNIDVYLTCIDCEIVVNLLVIATYGSIPYDEAIDIILGKVKNE